MKFLKKDTALPPYLMYPRFLLESDLSDTAKLLYVVLLDRARLSQENVGWTDGEGRVFVYYTIAELAKTIRKSDMTVKTALGALEKAGFIYRQHQGACRANRIFVKCLPEGKPSFEPVENSVDGRWKTCGKPIQPSNPCPANGQFSFPQREHFLSL
jgi:DNA-binding MarR family transcriptional regulator